MGFAVTRRPGDMWWRFFFEPCGTAPVAAFRIVIALLGLRSLYADFYLFDEAYSPDSLIPALWSDRQVAGNIDLFSLMPNSRAWALGILTLNGLAFVAIILNRQVRLSSIVAYLTFASIQNRCSTILSGCDRLHCIALFLLIFAPVQQKRSATEKSDGNISLRAPTAQRLLQLQLSVLYITTAWWKLNGETWRSGMASYYSTRLEIFNFPNRIPYIFEHVLTLKLLTWGTLAVELWLGIGLWIPQTRKLTLIVGVLFHLGLAMTLNIPYFQPTVLSFYILFVPSMQLEKFLARIRTSFGALREVPVFASRLGNQNER